ncbi:MAG: hypothetical protein RR737_08825 [Lachnospiraceae bacterium]
MKGKFYDSSKSIIELIDKANIVGGATIAKYYDLSSNNYHRNTTPFVSQDKECLLHNLVLIRGNVVWVEFGFNVGCEFGGKHPAIIHSKKKKL